MVSAHRGVARGLLLAALAMCVGCILPQTDPVLSPPLILLNRPPRILESASDPSPRKQLVQVQQSGIHFCANLPNPAVLSINAVDPDTCDTLHVQWYLDFDRDSSASWNPIRPEVLVSPPNRDFSTASLTLGSDPLDIDRLTVGPNGANTHVLEALVSDGEVTVPGGVRQAQPRSAFEQCSSQPITTLPDGGPAVDTTYFVTYAWTLVVSGTCP
jgi:hypothetical protein